MPTAVLVVDAANVVGSRPDGWWKDRAGAAERLLEAVTAARTAPGADPDLAARRVVVVLEGRACAATAPQEGSLDVVRAPTDGDAAIVEVVAREVAAVTEGGPAADVLVVTSDRALRERVAALGARTRGAGWLREMLDR